MSVSAVDPGSSNTRARLTPKKRSIVELQNEKADECRFKILLPNGVPVNLTFRDPPKDMAIADFVRVTKQTYLKNIGLLDSNKSRKGIMWESENLYLEDAHEKKIHKRIRFQDFDQSKCHLLWLHDGSADVPDNYENMWDLTPDTDLLTVVPKQYTFETALADLIDNSLQAVWCNGAKDRRFISVEINQDKLSIFDTGLGMDDNDENHIVKWGKMGASTHRALRVKAIGCKPPYLLPYFGMFGYGGPMASMQLGRRALVSSKTKRSRKVFTLRLERKALLSRSGSNRTWMTDGGVRDPLEEELENSPHGSFTKVEIFEPKLKRLGLTQLCCMLKDIYFPYIQCDELCKTGATVTPIEFQVNDTNLAEIEGGEIATTNLHSCNGPDFVLNLHFAPDSNNVANKFLKEAHARLKCVYFPIIEGKETIERILEKLEADGFGKCENFETFSRVSIRRLGRLLPDARWPCLPFMEPKLKKGEKVLILKRPYLRVKCFIDTDAGFNPTPYKSDLAHHHAYTTALRNLGNKLPEKDKDIKVEIVRDEKSLSPLQLEREYQQWILHMHDCYDEEIDRGEDQPVVVIKPLNKERLGISSDVLRVHRIIKRKGLSWKSGQKIKILRGTYSGGSKNHTYAILEYILLEGFEGDPVGDARLVCRPMDVSEKDGSILNVDSGSCNFDIRGSLSLPIGVIDSGKCLPIENAEWDCQVDKVQQKAPSAIDILSEDDCQVLGVDSALPTHGAVYAGHAPPKEIVAVIRPGSFVSSSSKKTIDNKYIVKDPKDMLVRVNFIKDAIESQNAEHIYLGSLTPTYRKGFHGLYILQLEQRQFQTLFQKAGVYTFTFSVENTAIKSCESSVQVRALRQVDTWVLLSSKRCKPYSVRVGSCFPPFSIASKDKYGNQIPFSSVPSIIAIIKSKDYHLANVKKICVNLSKDKSSLIVKDILVESDKLDKIRPNYEANLVIHEQDEMFSVCVPCQVKPGPLDHVILQPSKLDNQLVPGYVVKELQFEVFDGYGNHAEEGSEIELEVDGFHFEDKIGPNRMVDDNGYIDLSDRLKVMGGYGENVSISLISRKVVVFKKEFLIEKRELRAVSGIHMICVAGSTLENLVFEVVKPNGHLDEMIHNNENNGQSHMLTIQSDLFNDDGCVRYAFCHGRCNIPLILIPHKEGEFTFKVSHSRHPELNLSVKVLVHNAEEMEHPYFLLKDSLDARDDGHLMLSVINDINELQLEVKKYGWRIGELEKSLITLKSHKEKLQKRILELEVSVQSNYSSQSDLNEINLMMETIEQKDATAAGILCLFSRSYPFQDPETNMKDIVGIVALLGTVQSKDLSRILTEYLGEDQMLSVVCGSYLAASALEEYTENGEVDHSKALYDIATHEGKQLHGRFQVICLDNIRPYEGIISSDPQRKLLLPEPTFQSKGVPPGFLGYAVNMINMNTNHMQLRTAAGHGLRQTLFYSLFGELQVYETRKCMHQARPVIKHGAISLDGGIIRGNGFLSLGYGEPDIRFPVVPLENQMQPTARGMEMLREIEETKSVLRDTLDEMERMNGVRTLALKKFEKKSQQLRRLMEEKGGLING